METDSLAQVVVMEYLWGIWQDNQKRDCAPRSERPPWPISLSGECPSCPPAETMFVTDTIPDPVTEAALAAALATIDSLLAIPPPDPCEVCDTIPEPPPPAEEEGTIELLVSASPDRSAPQPVLGSLLNGNIYVFAVVGGRAADSVVFQIDAQIEHTELTTPYDLAGGSVSAASPYSTFEELPNGTHSFTAIARNGIDQWGVTANAIVSNPDSVAVIPSEITLGSGEQYVFTALIYFENVPYICMDDSILWEAKPAADESRACGVSDGARHGSCTNPLAHMMILSEEECPSVEVSVP